MRTLPLVLVGLLLVLSLGPVSIVPWAMATEVKHGPGDKSPAAAAELGEAILTEAVTGGGTEVFKGSVQWSAHISTTRQHVLLGKVNIPGRKLGVTLVIYPNTEATLPATHLIEATFTAPPDFPGGAVHTLAGVLMKDTALVRGEVMQGAAAQVELGRFLFALSNSPKDVPGNMALLADKGYLDLAIVYDDARRAVLTLETRPAHDAFKAFVAETTTPGPGN